jgi:hypothetical protein
MTDRREIILARLAEILAAVPPVQAVVRNVELKVFRNRGDLYTVKRPAILLLDADDVVQLTPSNHRAPALVDMTPEIYVLMDLREPPNENIGPDMNALRTAIVRAIFYDQSLVTILGGNGRIRYVGTTTDMASGRAMQGEMSIRLTFTYVLRPSEL